MSQVTFNCYLTLVTFCKLFVLKFWLGDRDSNPNSLIQSQMSYH